MEINEIINLFNSKLETVASDTSDFDDIHQLFQIRTDETLVFLDRTPEQIKTVTDKYSKVLEILGYNIAFMTFGTYLRCLRI